MSERIYTIPINDAFDRYEGCPICFLKDKLEETTLSYCLGAAMMEPDVRIEMNTKGFCNSHLNKMREMKNKLSLALILESRLNEVGKAYSVSPSGGKKSIFSSKALEADGADILCEYTQSCYVCEKIRFTENRYISNTVYLWEKDSKFRDKLIKQPYFCISHSAAILKKAKVELKSSVYTGIYDAVMSIQREYLSKISSEVSRFCESFDHRNAGKPLGEEKRSIEKAIGLLK